MAILGYSSPEGSRVSALLLCLASSSGYYPTGSQGYVHLLPNSACKHGSSFLQDPYFLEYRVYSGLSQTFSLLQLFVLGPRLIIDVREYHAKLIADSDAPIGMTSIAFRERVHVSTSSTV